MSYNGYNISIPYKDFLKLQEKEKLYNSLKENILSCFVPSGNDIINVDITKLKNIGIEFLPSRYLEYNFTEVK